MKEHKPNPAKRSSHFCFGLALLVALALPSCSRRQTTDNSKVSRPAAAVQTTSYQSVGVVKSTNNSGPTIELAHEEIKGLMPAMTMEFYVRDKSLLQGIKPGDRVAFTIENGVGGVKITKISKL